MRAWTRWASPLALAIAPAEATASPFAVPDMDAAEEIAFKLEAEYEASDSARAWAAPVVGIAMPLSDRIETEFVVGRGHAKDEGGRWRSGWLDAEWAVKAELIPIGEEGGFGLTAEPSLVIPIGSHPVTEDAWRLELPLVLGWRSGPLTLHLMAGYSAALSDGGNDEIPLGLLATYDVDDRLTIGAEVVGHEPMSRLERHEAIVNVGGSYALAESWAIEARIGRTIHSHEERATNLMVGLEKSF